MHLPRRDWLKMAGIGFPSLAFSSWTILDAQSKSSYLPKQPIKLRSNENPYGPSAKAKAAIAANLGMLNRYSWDVTGELLASLAAHHHVKQENILVGAGSTELLDIIGRYAALRPGELLLPDPVFDYWTVTTTRMGLKKILVPVTADKQTDLNKILSAINDRTRLIYICNPNNPTGTICSYDTLADFIAKVDKKALILVDEAYLEFADQRSVSGLINEHSNLLVVKTFSKIYGLAGARIGYALGSAELMGNIERLQSSPNASVSGTSAAAAIASLQDHQFVRDCIVKNNRVREYMTNELAKMGLRFIPTSANFIYFSLESYRHNYFARLKSANIEGTKIYEEQGKWTRITLGTMTEMQKFIQAIK